MITLFRILTVQLSLLCYANNIYTFVCIYIYINANYYSLPNSKHQGKLNYLQLLTKPAKCNTKVYIYIYITEECSNYSVKVIHVQYDLRKMFITLASLDSPIIFVPAPFILPVVLCTCMSNVNPYIHY